MLRKYGKYINVNPTAKIGHNVELELGDMTHIGPGVRIVGYGRVKFGDYCKVHDGCLINVGDGGYIEFGHNCWFGERTVLDGTGGLSGGNDIGVGIASHLYTHIAHGDVIEGCRFMSVKKMTIEDDVWFVGQCLVSPIHAKAKSMAMLGSVVAKDMEMNRVYAGTPAKDITDKVGPPWIPRTDEDKFLLLEQTKAQYLNTHDPNFTAHTQFSIVPCFDLPPLEAREPGVTYISVSSRKYTKLLTETERNFMSWLTSYRGRFIPE